MDNLKTRWAATLWVRALSDRIDTELALAALRMANSTRALEPNWIHHTDRDCRYGSDDYLAELKRLGARPEVAPIWWTPRKGLFSSEFRQCSKENHVQIRSRETPSAV